MRKSLMTAGIITLASLTMSGPASAFGDKCHAPIVESGDGSSQRGAMRHAQRHWEKAASRQHGAAAADWYYSSDRGFTCTWNEVATQFTCIARATPCQRR